jgi:hypothetical protein
MDIEKEQERMSRRNREERESRARDKGRRELGCFGVSEGEEEECSH